MSDEEPKDRLETRDEFDCVVVAAVLRRIADDIAAGKFPTISAALEEFRRRIDVMRGIA